MLVPIGVVCPLLFLYLLAAGMTALKMRTKYSPGNRINLIRQTLGNLSGSLNTFAL